MGEWVLLAGFGSTVCASLGCVGMRGQWNPKWVVFGWFFPQLNWTGSVVEWMVLRSELEGPHFVITKEIYQKEDIV